MCFWLVKGTQNMLFAGLVEKIQALLRQEGQDAAVYYLDEDAMTLSIMLAIMGPISTRP